MTVAVSSPERARAAWLGWGLVALTLAFVGLGAALRALTPASLQPDRSILGPGDLVELSFLAYVAVGALVVSHRPHNLIGWIFCAIGLAWEIFSAATADAEYLALVSPAAFRAAIPWLVLPVNLWSVAVALAPAVLLYFPNGQLLSRRWQPVVWLLALSIAAVYATSASDFSAGPLQVQLPSPLELLGLAAAGPMVNGLHNAALISIPLFFLAGVVAIGLRWRRAGPDERQQLKWFVYGTLLLVAVEFVEAQFFDALHPLDPSAVHTADLFYGIPFAVAFAAIPVTAGIAILKYRLYDIDLIIRRTLVYSVLTTLLALVYLGTVLVLQGVFTALTGAGQSELVTVLSTLAIAALFVPLRNRVQAVIDRRFYGRKVDAARTLAEFGATLRDHAAADLNELTERLLAAVDESMQPETVCLWLAAPKRTVKR